MADRCAWLPGTLTAAAWLVLLVSMPPPCPAQDPPSLPESDGFTAKRRTTESALERSPNTVIAQTKGRSESLSRLARLLALSALPRQYEDRRQWGMQAERWDGIKIRREGWRLETKRRKKAVNHGTWKMYRVRMLDPAEEFVLQVDNVRQLAGGEAACDVTILARLAVFGRISKWEKGVQLYSFSADAEARVRLEMECRFRLAVDPTRFPPDLILEPAVAGAAVDLIEFRLKSLSDLRGPLAKQLGRAMQGIVEDQLRRQQPKIPEKINRQIAKNQDQLKLSLEELLRDQWEDWKTSNVERRTSNVEGREGGTWGTCAGF